MRHQVVALLALLALSFAAAPARAGVALSNSWQGSDGDTWDNAASWSGGVPTGGQTALLATDDGSFQTITFQNPANTSPLAALTIDATNNGSMTLSQDQDTLSTITLTVGDAGTGTYNLGTGVPGGGTLSAQNVIIGAQNGSQGTLNFNVIFATSAQATVTQSTVVGGAGFGQLNINADTFNAGQLIVGQSQTGQGFVSQLSNTTLNDDAIIGDAGTGSYSNSGTHNVSGNLILGNQSTGTGSYTVIGSNAQTNVQFVSGGNNGAAVNVNGGGNNANGALIVGENGDGSFTQEFVAGSDATPTVNVAGDLVLGHQPNSVGNYTLNDGTLAVGGKMVVGGSSTGANRFTQNGGTVNLTGSAFGNSDYVGVGNSDGIGGLFIGGGGANIDNGSGLYELTNGSLNTGFTEVGHFGIGTFDQSGGTHTTGGLDIGNTGAGFPPGNAVGVYSLTGTGQLTVNGDELVGAFGNGSFGQGDGQGLTRHTVTGTLSIGDGPVITGDLQPNQRGGAYTLTDGTLTTGNTIVGNQGAGTFNQSGGTHEVQSSLTLGAQSTPVQDLGSGVTAGGASQGTYSMSGGTLQIDTGNGGNGNPGTGVPGSFIVGDQGVGTFTQTGGQVVAGRAAGDGYAGQPNQLFNLTIGNQANTAGAGGTTAPSSYSLTSSDQNNPASLTVNGNLNLGANPGAQGNLTIGSPGLSSDATSLTVNHDPWNTDLGGNILVGVNGASATQSSTLTQINGSVTAANDVAIGINPSPGIGGIYDQFGGTLTTPTLEVGGSEIFSQAGSGGSGIYTQTGGLVTIGGWFGGQILANGSVVPGPDNGPGVLGTLIVGAQGGSGLYELGTGAGGQTNTAVWGGYPFTAGAPPPAFDSINNAPYLQVFGNAMLGADAGSSGTFLLAGDGSSLNINDVVGLGGQGTLTVGASGNGTFNQTDLSSVYLDGSLAVGINQGSTSSYTLSAGANGAGSLSVGGDLEIGGTDHVGDPIAQTAANGGAGTFSQSAGTVTVQGNLTLGTDGDGSGNPGFASGTYNLSGGTLTVNNLGYFGNNGGTGTFNQTDGSATFGGLQLGTTPSGGPASSGAYNIAANYDGTNFTTSPSLTVNGDVDLGVNANTSGSMTIGTLGLDGLGDPTTVTIGGNMTVGDAGTGNLTVNSGSLSILNGNAMQIGVNGAGAVVQNGGSVSAGFVDLSVPAGSGNSSYTIGGIAALDAGVLNVAGAGSGHADFTQNDSSTVTVSQLFVNNNNGTAGTYTINGGTLTAGDNFAGDGIQIGGGGDAFFTQNGGIVNVGIDPNASGPQFAQLLNLGANSGDRGTYTIGNGTLNVYGNADFGNSAIEVGSAGVGTFIQTGGTVNTYGANGLAVGDCCGGSGEYDISSGILNVNLNPTIGPGSGNAFVGANSLGNMTQSGDAVVSVAGDLFVGYSASGTYALGGSGSLTIGGELNIGTNATGYGTVNYNTATGDQAGLSVGSLVVGDSGTGTFTEGSADNATDLNLQASGAALVIGRSQNGTGTFNLAAGSTLEDDMIVGDAGTGTMNNAGGTHSVTGNLVLGNQASGNGTYNLTAGAALDVSGFTTVGNAGTGTFLNDASTHTTQSMVLGGQPGSSGSYTLQNGGVLNIGAPGNAGFLDVAESGTATLTQTGGATSIIGALDIGRCGAVATATCNNGADPYTGAAGTGTFNVSGGSVAVQFDAGSNYGGFAKVGDAGSGTFNISGGANFAADFLGLGEDGGSGTVTMNDAGTLITVGALGVGDSGHGTFTQNDGIVTVTANGLVIGTYGPTNDGFANLPAGSGEYDLNGGSLSVTGGEFIGAAGQGTLNQTAGLNSADFISIGNNTGGSGQYLLSGTGMVSDSGTLFVGAAGTGDLNQSGGTISAAGLVLGNNSGTPTNGSGTYELSGGSVAIGGDTFLGGDTGTSGVVTQTGGTASLDGNVILGNGDHSEGQYILRGSNAASLTIGGNLDIAAGAASSGSFYFNYDPAQSQAGGNATLSFATPGSQLLVGDQATGLFVQGGGDLNLAAQGVTLDIGVNPGSSGSYDLVGGTLEDDVIVGDAGTGLFNNSGGTHTVSGNLIVGNQPTGIGTYTLGGSGNLTLGDANAQIILGNQASGSNLAQGTFNYNTSPGDAGTITFANTGQSIVVGKDGSGVFTQGGGDLNLAASSVGLDIAQNAGSLGQYNMNGGTLETLSLNVGDGGQGQFNQSGGSATVNGNLIAGNQTGSAGTVSIGAGSVTVTGDATIGNSGFGSLSTGGGAAVDVKGSMTIADSSAGGGVAVEGGALTVGDGGSGHSLTIGTSGSMKIEDTGGANPVGAQVTVDGALVNNGQLALGLHQATPAATLTVTNGFTNNGSFNFEANSVLNANVTNSTTGFFTAQNGATTNVTLNGDMDNSGLVNVGSSGFASSTLTQNGSFTNRAAGTLQVTGSSLTINNSGGTALDNFGTVTIQKDANQGGPISTVSVTGDVTNETNATLTLANSTLTVNGNTSNLGTITVTNSTAHWNGVFTNNGAYHSDPSTSDFIDLDIGAAGYLTGGSGDVFDVSGDFMNESTQKTLWDTVNATLEFSTGTGTSHHFELAGVDDGTLASGFTDNFAWGLLQIDLGNSLILDALNTADALYVRALDGLSFAGDEITNIFGNGNNIYYDPSVDTALNGQVFALQNGGDLCPVGAASCTPSAPPPQVPEPSSLLLLGAGLVGLIIWRRRGAIGPAIGR